MDFGLVDDDGLVYLVGRDWLKWEFLMNMVWVKEVRKGWKSLKLKCLDPFYVNDKYGGNRE
jgi:hypothetical protein